MILEGERSPGGGNGNPHQYSCLGNPMDRGTWRAKVHGVTKESDTAEQLSVLVSTHSHTHTHTHSYILPEMRGSQLLSSSAVLKL